MLSKDTAPTLAALETLGCKVNQYESSYLLEAIKQAGYQLVPFQERADIYIVHSCAVTSKAGYQTRQLLRRAKRANPRAKIIVAGCDAQLEAERLAAEQLATHILGNVEKLDLLNWLQVPGSFSAPCRAVSDARCYPDLRPICVSRMHSGRARAFLKVQDGCDAFCSYCVVPYTRGRSRSLMARDVRTQLDRYLASGYHEVVLSGIHLGQWGKDLSPAQDLTTLLQFLAQGPLPPRIRISSLEPKEWSPQLLELLTSLPQICSHFHIPLQSGNEEILKRMRRPYTPAQYAELVRDLHSRYPKAALGADVLVGFPGETESHFESTVQLIRQLPLSYLHIFPYSPRPGTAAARYPGRVTGTDLKQRTRKLRNLDQSMREAFWDRSVGHHVQVLVETQVAADWWRGTSENYLQVRFRSAQPLQRGSLQTVCLTDRTTTGLLGVSVPTAL